MKIICDSAELAKAAFSVQRTVSGKSTIPSLEGILIEAFENKIKLTGYDLEVGSTIVIDADVRSEGKIVLNAKNFCDILRMVPADTVSVDCDDRNISKIKSGETEYSLIGTSADDYPELPDVGIIELEDAETGRKEWVDTSSRRVREHYAAAWRERSEQILQTLKHNRIDTAEILTDGDYVAELIKLFKQR